MLCELRDAFTGCTAVMTDLHLLGQDAIVGHRLIQTLNLRSCRESILLPSSSAVASGVRTAACCEMPYA